MVLKWQQELLNNNSNIKNLSEKQLLFIRLNYNLFKTNIFKIYQIDINIASKIHYDYEFSDFTYESIVRYQKHIIYLYDILYDYNYNACIVKWIKKYNKINILFQNKYLNEYDHYKLLKIYNFDKEIILKSKLNKYSKEMNNYLNGKIENIDKYDNISRNKYIFDKTYITTIEFDYTDLIEPTLKEITTSFLINNKNSFDLTIYLQTIDEEITNDFLWEFREFIDFDLLSDIFELNDFFNDYNYHKCKKCNNYNNNHICETCLIFWNDICSICLENPKIDGIITKCNHMFCIQCLSNWNEYHKTCPNCRKKININNIN
jgi:hypothetical protein